MHLHESHNTTQTARAGASAHATCGTFLFLAAVVLVGGCSQARQYQPAVDPQTLNDAQFVHYLGTVPVVTFSEACRAIIIAADGKDVLDNYEARYAELRDRGFVREAWDMKPDHVLDLGTLAFMAAQVCQLPPSVNSALLGSWGLGDRRYAVKQAASREIVCYGPPYKPVSGGQMLLALARMDEYMARKGIYDFGGADINAPEEATRE